MRLIERILGRGEKIPTLAELEKEFVGVVPISLPRLDWNRRSEVTTPFVGFTTSALELHNTSAYKGEKGWQAYLVYGETVTPMSNFQGEVLPGARLVFSFRGSGYFRSGGNKLYLKTDAVTLNGEDYEKAKWIFEFEPPSIGGV